MLLLVTALALAALAFVLSRSERHRAAPTAAVLAAYLLPALFLLAYLFLAPPSAERLRIALLAYGFRGAEGKDVEVTVGGDREAHDLWLEGFEGAASEAPPLGTLRFQPPVGAGPAARGRVSLTVPERVLDGTLLTRGPGGWELPQAVPLEDGDRLRLGAQGWRFVVEDGLFTFRREVLRPEGVEEGTEDAAVVIPRRWGGLPFVDLRLPILRSFSVAQRSHPLAWLTRQGPDPHVGRLASFLFRDPEGRLYVAALEPEVTVEKGAETAESAEAASTETGAGGDSSILLDPGERVHAVGLPRGGSGFEAGGLRDRRSFRVLPGQRSLVLVLDTPEIHSLTRQEVAALAERPRQNRPVDPAAEAAADEAPEEPLPEAADEAAPDTLRVQLAMGDWRVTDRFLHLHHASQRLSGEAFGTLELPADWSAGILGQARAPAVVSPQGQQPLRPGEPFWLGSNHLAAVQVDLLSPPLALGLLGLLLALARVAAARAAGLGRGALLVAAALEALLAVRLLLAFRVWAMPPFAVEALELALAAWALLPWAFLVACLPPADRTWEEDGPGPFAARWGPALGGWLLALAWCWRLGGGGLKPWVWTACLLFALAVPILRGERPRRALRQGWQRFREGPLHRLQIASGRGRAATGRVLRRGWNRVLRRPEAAPPPVVPIRPPGAPLSPRAWHWLALLPTALRLLLLILGYRESLPLGATRFSLSLLHVPAVLALEAAYLLWLWRQASRQGRLRLADLLPALTLVVGAWAIPAVLVSDLGLALLNVPIFLLALASLCLVVRRELGGAGRATLLWLPAAALALYGLLVASPLAVRGLLRSLPEGVHLRLASERNYLRLLAFAYPDRLQELGRRSSEELAVMSTVLEAYTAGERPLLGRGWFGSEVSPHLRATALREHVPAVFVAAEWGLVAILALLLLYHLIAAQGMALLPWRDPEGAWAPRGPPTFWAILGGLAALTFAMASFYMVLANYGLVLFTGRNAYLLGLDSAADVLESFLLVVLFAVGVVEGRDADE